MCDTLTISNYSFLIFLEGALIVLQLFGLARFITLFTIGLNGIVGLMGEMKSCFSSALILL